MGLDMYVFTTKEQIEADVDFDFDTFELLHRWRKHPNLHGMMSRIYFEKGGQNPDFNCSRLQLIHADLDLLECVIKTGTLPYTEGFFFGESDGSEKEDDLEFIEKARRALDSGLTVVYSAWW